MLSKIVRFMSFLVLASLSLAACGQPPVPEAKPETIPETFTDCCDTPERLPGFVGRFGLAVAPVVAPLFGSHKLRAGHLEHQPTARAALLSDLKPLDSLLTSSRHWTSGALIPGRFTHVMMYLGTEHELKRLGVWNDPHVVPHHNAVRAGKHFVESDRNGTRLLKVEKALDTDMLVVLRPRTLPTKAKARAVRSTFERVGEPFGFQFDLSDCSRSFCTSLIHRAVPELKLRVQTVYGRPTILPDEFAASALTPNGQLRMVRYLRGTKTGWNEAGPNQLARDMNSYWQAPLPFPRLITPDHSAPKVNLCAAGKAHLSLPDGRSL